MKVIDVSGILTREVERGRAEYSASPPLETDESDASILRPVKLIFSLLTLFTRRQSFIKYFHSLYALLQFSSHKKILLR